MSDLPDDTPASDDVDEPTERLALPSLDSFKAVRDLIALVIDPRMVKRNLRSLHDALAATTAAQRQLETYRAEHDAHIAKTTAELAAERDALMKRRVDVHQAEASLAERTERIGKLEAAWRGLKLPGDTFSTFGGLTRQEPYTALQKAKFATEHGRLPDHPDKEDTEAQAEPPAEQSRTVVVGRDGTTLAQTIPEPAAARVRPGRRGAAHAE